MRLRSLPFVVLPLLVFVTGAPGQPTDASEFFEARIRPLLAENCFACHAEAETSGLRLDSRRAMIEGGSRGPAVLPGSPEASLLMHVVRYEHPLVKMPPTGQLDDRQVAHLERWIRDGAVWPESPSEFFRNQVRPVLESRCLACHGENPMGGLRMDSGEELAKGGASGPAVVPGKPEESLLIRTVRYEHERLIMPPTAKLPDEEIALLEGWVKGGALWPGESEAGGFVITAQDRAHWSYQPVRKRPVPGIPEPTGHAVDGFIRARLAESGLAPAPRADKRTLIRRVTYDLTGLPPKPEEIKAFLADDAPGAYARLVDRLLQSPHYGERWGRHWMDVVRYSDTSGDSADYPIPQMRHYRDYIIAAFNHDKPFDEFVRAQIAGDLLPATDEADRWENVVATGYLANARRFDVLPERSMHLTYEDAIDNLGKVFLGLSVSCARCHDHKFDPISQADYYALYGILDSTGWPYAGSERRRGQWNLTYREPEGLERWGEGIAGEWNDLHAELRPLVAETDDYFRPGAVAIENPVVKERNSDSYKRVQDLFKQRRKLLEKIPVAPQAAFALFEDEPRDAAIQIRGEPDKPGKRVPRRFLAILGGQQLENPESSGRRELAEWIVDPGNPLTARVMVNRIWQYHFGRGLVGSPNDFGVRGETPAHPELLDYLAARFVEENWSIKAMHRLILLSETYRQSSGPNPKAAVVDPDNRLLWRWSRRRLSAEELRDAILSFGGKLDTGTAAEHPFPPQSEWDYTQHKPYQAVYESNQRSVYLMTQRIQKHPYLAMFDGADTNSTTAIRKATTNPIQALYLMNSEQLHECAAGLAERLSSEADTSRDRIDLAHWIVYGRPATDTELDQAAAYLAKAQIALAKAEIPEDQHRLHALESYARSLLSSNEFLFVD